MTAIQPDILDHSWNQLLDQLEQAVGKRPADLNGVLFLIGVQELGKGPRHFSKEQKQDLMHIGICAVLATAGYYQPAVADKDGWPQFTLLKPVPHQDVLGQENFLKEHVLHYFDQAFT